MPNISKLIASFFYLGHSPLMPGTVGSLAGVGVYLLVKNNIILYTLTIVFLFVLGMLFSSEAERVYKMKDAKMIVIDEVCGMLVAFYVVPYSPITILIGFILYRILDIIKPPPARRLEKLTGAWGIMLDDLLAGLYTNLLLRGTVLLIV